MVTASIDSIDFKILIKQGDIVELGERVGRTSLRVRVEPHRPRRWMNPQSESGVLGDSSGRTLREAVIGDILLCEGTEMEQLPRGGS
jgi:hypothetical protein